MCYLLRLLHSQIPPSNEMLDIQIYNSRLKENSLLCMLNHLTRETGSSFVPASQQLSLMCCTTDLLAEQLLVPEKGHSVESKARVTLGAGIINTMYHESVIVSSKLCCSYWAGEMQDPLVILQPGIKAQNSGEVIVALL